MAMTLQEAMWSRKPFRRLGSKNWLVYMHGHVYCQATEEVVQFNADDVMSRDYVTLEHGDIVTYTELKNAWKEVFGSLTVTGSFDKVFIKEEEKLEQIASRLNLKRRNRI